jgi:hypothetical protein
VMMSDGFSPAGQPDDRRQPSTCRKVPLLLTGSLQSMQVPGTFRGAIQKMFHP